MVGKLAHNDVGEKPHIGLAPLDGMIRHGGNDDARTFDITVGCAILGPLVHIDDQFARPVLKFLGDLPTDLLEGLSGLGAGLLLFGDVQHDLHPLQMLGDGNPARVIALGFDRRCFFSGSAGNWARGSILGAG